ncbi:hypothetical protein P0Y35_10095 [Kiritimatiellaeota bacterium B1221]|nr:hypothetical protein [Kiritimatiellaeota bacterium B1221]
MKSIITPCCFIVFGFAALADEGVAVAGHFSPVVSTRESFGVDVKGTDFYLETLKHQIVTAFGSEGAEVSVVLEEEDLNLKYRTRHFWIHSGSKTGEWSEKAREVEGPSHKGIMVRVMMQPASLRRAWDRSVNDAGATIAFESSAPYWKSFIWVMPVADGNKHVMVILDHGSGADRDTLKKLKQIFSELR